MSHSRSFLAGIHCVCRGMISCWIPAQQIAGMTGGTACRGCKGIVLLDIVVIPEVVFGDPDRCPAPQYTLFPAPKPDSFRFWNPFFLFSGKHRIFTNSLHLRKSKKSCGCMICFVCSFFRKRNDVVPVFRKIWPILMDKKRPERIVCNEKYPVCSV